VSAGGFYYQFQNYGLFCFNYGTESYSFGNIGSRPMKLP
jgi:hypothetical protein